MDATLIEDMQIAKCMGDLPHRVRLLWSTALSKLPYCGVSIPVRWMAESHDNFWGDDEVQLSGGAAICWSRWRVILGGVQIEVYDVCYTGNEIPGLCRYGAWAFCDDPDTGKEWAMQLLVSSETESYDEVSDSYHEGTPQVFWDFLARANEFALLRTPLVTPMAPGAPLVN